jgi:heme/copper-type cytochrome/quinol oxidase subunit 3
MEGSASAPTHPSIELEPPEWQPRVLWVGARQLCGVASFFFISFVFAYFYLRSLDSNNSWKIGRGVSAPVGWGVAIVVVLILSALALRAAATRPELTVRLGALAVVLVLLSVVLQVIEWTTLGFGPASGGYASVYVGWTAFFAVFTLPGAFWIETQVATAWRRGREQIRGTEPASPADVYTSPEVIKAGLDACSFFWSFYVFTGVVLFVCLYLL